MKKILGSLCIIVFLLSSCTPHKKYFYIGNGSYNSSVYSSGFATEGNDYYYINVSESEPKPDAEYRRIDESISVPARYIVDVDAKYQYLLSGQIKMAKEDGVNDEIPTPVIDKFIVKIYDIGTKELVRAIDVKSLIENYGEDISITRNITYDIWGIDGNPYIAIPINDTIHSTKEEKDIILTYRWFCVNLFTEEYLISEGAPYKFINAREKETILFEKRFEFYKLDEPDIKYRSGLYISNMTYWEGCKCIKFYLDQMPANTEKLYSKFPSLKAEIEELKRQGMDKRAYVHIILTDNPSFYELISYMEKDGYKVGIGTIKIFGIDSIDGEDHETHSIEEWYSYYKYFKPEDMVSEWLSPIFPREN